MKIGRNDPCPCGSGHKFKKCCLNKVFAYTFLVTSQEFDTFKCQILLTEDDTLCSLHYHLQEALDWDNDHMFSFFMDNKIWSRKAEYSANPLGEGSADICLKNVLQKEQGRKFAYVFDYGDEHFFEMEVIKVERVDDLDNLVVGVIEQQGKLPPQYDYYDDNDEGFAIEDYPLEMDLEVIEKTSLQKKDENWKFRSFLKMYDGDIDELIHEIARNVSERIDCTKCANCCKKISPVLKESDIKNLSSSLSIVHDDFKKRYLERGSNSDFIFKKTPCSLLKDNRCTQYEHRPDDCRSFPHLHKKDFITRLWNTVENHGVCPIIFNSYEILKSEFDGWQYQSMY